MQKQITYPLVYTKFRRKLWLSKEQVAISKRDQAYLSVASYMASQSKCRMKHGAVVVRGGRVLGIGVNKERNHPMIVSTNHIKDHCSVHAEIDAIRKARDVSGATIYVARVNKRGQNRDSKPCKNCYDAMTELGIRKIIYTTSED